MYIVGESHGGPPRHVALFGLRRRGKTLVCQEQMRRLHARGNVIPVYFALQDSQVHRNSSHRPLRQPVHVLMAHDCAHAQAPLISRTSSRNSQATYVQVTLRGYHAVVAKNAVPATLFDAEKSLSPAW